LDAARPIAKEESDEVIADAGVGSLEVVRDDILKNNVTFLLR
jgi:hypothetical protein